MTPRAKRDTSPQRADVKYLLHLPQRAFSISFSVALSILVNASAIACGGSWQGNYVHACDGSPHGETWVIRMPEAAFRFELQRFLKSDPLSAVPSYDWYNRDENASYNKVRWQNTLNKDVQDLAIVLRAQMADQSQCDALLTRYEEMRTAMRPPNLNLSWYKRLNDKNRQASVDAAAQPPFVEADFKDVLDQLPNEFRLYVQGSIQYYQGNFQVAADLWKSLLALPEQERKHRSTWAAFMAGRALLHIDPEQALDMFKLLQELVAAGFDDSLGLEVESKTWEPEAYFLAGDPAAAFQRYASLYQSGSWLERTIAMNEMRAKATQCIADKDLRERAATDRLSRQVIAAALVSISKYQYQSRFKSADLEAWIKTLEEARLSGAVEGADQLAWAAYDRAEYALAKRCLALCDPKWPYAQWVKSKLELRDGKVSAAIETLTVLADKMPEDEWSYDSGEWIDTRPDVWAEIGALKLGRGEFVDAFSAFLRSRRDAEIAYMVERVFSTDEVEQILAGNLHGKIEIRLSTPLYDRQGEAREFVARLLARRFARQAQWDKAAQYTPDFQARVNLIKERLSREPAVGTTKQATVSYIRAPWVKRDPRVPVGIVDRDLADSKISAAFRIFEDGRDIMGTWLDPDWNASYAFYGAKPGISELRARDATSVASDESSYRDPNLAWANLPRSVRGALWSTAEEKRRLKLHAVVPEKQFHYRYKAASLMWQAAILLPDNDPQLMQVLWEGGKFIKARDPKAAEPFYRALVVRNRQQAYAQEADRIHWFPKTPPDEWDENSNTH